MYSSDSDTNIKEILMLLVDTMEALAKNYNQEVALNLIKLKAKIMDLNP